MRYKRRGLGGSHSRWNVALSVVEAEKKGGSHSRWYLALSVEDSDGSGRFAKWLDRKVALSVEERESYSGLTARSP